MAAGTRRSIDVLMEANNKSMYAVVVVGYGTVKRKDFTGAVSSISKDEINDFPAAKMQEWLLLQKTGTTIHKIAIKINPVLRGWINIGRCPGYTNE